MSSCQSAESVNMLPYYSKRDLVDVNNLRILSGEIIWVGLTQSYKPLKSRVFSGWWQKGQPGRHAPADLKESRYPWCELAVEGCNL